MLAEIVNKLSLHWEGVSLLGTLVGMLSVAVCGLWINSKMREKYKGSLPLALAFMALCISAAIVGATVFIGVVGNVSSG